MSAPARSAPTPFSEQREALLNDTSLRGPAFCRAYAGLVDEWLSVFVADEPDVALVAVGGYGRRELAPGSDLDVVLVHRGRRDVASLAKGIWYPIWDAGLALDHSVKTVKEALNVARSDLKAALGLVDARAIAGDLELGEELADGVRKLWQKHARGFMRQLGDAVADRHARMGDVAFLLEPDLKEGRGGLRDVHALRVAALAVPVVPEDDLIAQAAETLMAARVELHRSTGKSSDRLMLQEQEQVARALDFPTADALMQRVSAAGRTVGWSANDAWRRIHSWLAGPSSRVARRDREISPGVVLRDDDVVIDMHADLSDESLPLRVGAASALAGAPIGRTTLIRLRADAVTPGEPWAAATREALISLLSAGPGAVHAFEALDQYDLLVRVLPEWEPVRSRLQHNPYHRYTVDRHLLEAAAGAAALTGRVSRPDLLLIAALLHDIGKGYPGDHTEAGVELMARIARRMGFAPSDVDILVGLVQNHLLLADAATRRDIRDPATISQVAEAVRDSLSLELLHALTEADMKATGETAWTPWKQGLLADLVAQVERVLRGADPEPRPQVLEPQLQELAAQAGGGLLVKAEGPELIVVAPDRPGLFCHVAGVLSLHGLDIVAADAWCADGEMVVDVFRVHRSLGGDPDWRGFHRDLAKVLDGALALEARLADRVRAYATHGARKTRRPINVGVTVDNNASEDASVVEVRAPDALSVLYRIAHAFVELQLDIRHAKVLTMGEEVLDSFYVVDRQGAKLTDKDRIAELERAVLFELSRLAPTG